MTKKESKRSNIKPRNLLGRLFSSSEIESEITKTPDIKIELTCEKEPETTGGTEYDTALIQENVCLYLPLTEPTCLDTPQEPIEPRQNQLSDAAEELNPTEGLEKPILLLNGYSGDDTVPSTDLESV